MQPDKEGFCIARCTHVMKCGGSCIHGWLLRASRESYFDPFRYDGDALRWTFCNLLVGSTRSVGIRLEFLYRPVNDLHRRASKQIIRHHPLE